MTWRIRTRPRGFCLGRQARRERYSRYCAGPGTPDPRPREHQGSPRRPIDIVGQPQLFRRESWMGLTCGWHKGRRSIHRPAAGLSGKIAWPDVVAARD